MIGITGKSCSGKDFLTGVLRDYGCNEINLDAIGHIALQNKASEVLQVFPQLRSPSLSGSTEENSKKIIDRKKLRVLVFRNQALLHKLEKVLHPHMKELVLQELESLKGFGSPNTTMESSDMPNMAGEHTRSMDLEQQVPQHNIILNAAILEKLGLLPLCDIVLWVTAPLWLRARRAQQREQISLLQFLRRNRAQRSLRRPGGQTPTVFFIRNGRSNNFQDARCKLQQQLRQIPQLRPVFEAR